MAVLKVHVLPSVGRWAFRVDYCSISSVFTIPLGRIVKSKAAAVTEPISSLRSD